MNKLNKTAKRQLIALLVLVVIATGLFIHGQQAPVFSDGGMPVKNALKQYEIVKHSGSRIDACIQAGRVKQAYLEASNEADYKIWRTMQKLDCEAAGVPLQ